MEDSAAQAGSDQWFPPRREPFRLGDLVLLVASDQSRYLVTLRPGEQLHTHQGVFAHDAIVGVRAGHAVTSVLGHVALALEPGLDDLMRHLKRGSQVIYAKDAAWIVHRLGLRAGSRVIEAGTGSGGMTMALAWAVAPTGVVYTYEARDDAYAVARRNLERVRLLPYVQMHQASIEEGFRQEGVDALFLDVREPWRFLAQVRAALRPGGCFAGLLPTTNQVSNLLEGLESQGFADIVVEELLLRPYKPVPDRLRPVDTMPAHTGFLVFARVLGDVAEAGRWLGKQRQRYLARRAAEERHAAEAETRERERNPEGKKYPRLPLP